MAVMAETSSQEGKKLDCYVWLCTYAIYFIIIVF